MPGSTGSLGTSAGVLLVSILLGGCQVDTSTSNGGSALENNGIQISRAIDRAFIAAIDKCSVNVNYDTDYVPAIRIMLDRDGALSSPPVLLNPSNNSNDKEIIDAAFKSVKRCNPFSVGKRYPDYYGLWSTYVLKFDINLHKRNAVPSLPK